MAIKLTPEANSRLAVYRLHDADAFDALRRLLARIDEKPNSGTLIADLRDPPSGLPSATRRLYQRLRDALADLRFQPDARILVERLPSPAADAPLAAVIFYARDLSGGPAVATVVDLGVVLRQPGSRLT